MKYVVVLILVWGGFLMNDKGVFASWGARMKAGMTSASAGRSVADPREDARTRLERLEAKVNRIEQVRKRIKENPPRCGGKKMKVRFCEEETRELNRMKAEIRGLRYQLSAGL